METAVSFASAALTDEGTDENCAKPPAHSRGEPGWHWQLATGKPCQHCNLDARHDLAYIKGRSKDTIVLNLDQGPFRNPPLQKACAHGVRWDLEQAVCNA